MAGKGSSSSSTPKNWPSHIPYLKTPAYSRALNPIQLKALRTRTSTAQDTPQTPLGPCPLVRITQITNPSHPANGQSGLFAAKDLPPGSFILPYIGEVHGQGAAHEASDYDLSLDRDTELAVDAARSGNEARFVNDYRGVPGVERPNAEFREGWDGKERAMGVWVLPAGKAGKGKGIKKGEEILVSYGRGFWGARKEVEEGDAGSKQVDEGQLD
ncbi:hypothetical protein V502_07137 [Pseudogymnoascus sp. VKM F-4520 (FW-2644)]|nr:hypothetical protein V502_07137 [Pseudogymnoascus sp. VKM F-4520 (FW-2644)]